MYLLAEITHAPCGRLRSEDVTVNLESAWIVRGLNKVDGDMAGGEEERSINRIVCPSDKDEDAIRSKYVKRAKR